MTEFEKWDILYRNQEMTAFNNNPKGLLWLKVRAICRGHQIKNFAHQHHIQLKSKKISEQNSELFYLLCGRRDGMDLLDSYLTDLNHEWYNEKNVNIEKLKNDLYQIHYYSWGGDQNNSLDKYLVTRYVKVISNFQTLIQKQTEIGINAWNYVQNSWDNNWTSFLIESIFKLHSKVISAVGEIKSVDFFIAGFPIDLKVTFFPNQFMELKLKEILGASTLTWMKRRSRDYGITLQGNFANNQQMYMLSEKLKELGHNEIIDDLAEARGQIIQATKNNPYELIQWLYENQGEMRFGAENRIYLILVDTKEYDQSWKMKRAFSLIQPKVNEYLDNFNHDTLKQIDFLFKKKEYTALADAIFIAND